MNLRLQVGRDVQRVHCAIVVFPNRLVKLAFHWSFSSSIVFLPPATYNNVSNQPTVISGSLAVWPDVKIESSQIFPKDAQKVTIEDFLQKRDILWTGQNAQQIHLG